VSEDESLPAGLRPTRGELGVLADFASFRDRVVRAWELFDQTLETVALDGPTRSRGNRARDLLIPLGAWPDARGIRQMIDDARAGVMTTETESQSASRLRAAHEDATDAQVLGEFRRSAEHIATWVSAAAATDEARLVAPSPLGPVPIGTMVHAAAFQLAVTARDLRPAGAADEPELDALGVVGLVDSSGAVAARLDATASIAAVTPEVAAGTGALPGRWRTRVSPDDHEQLGPAVLASAGLLVDTAAGRIDLVGMARGLRVRDGRGLVGMSIVLDGIPDLPAAGMLRRAGSLVRLGRLGR